MGDEDDEEVISTPVVQTSVPQHTSETIKEVSSAPARSGSKKQVSKPVVNRTVRVDIEILDVLMNAPSNLFAALPATAVIGGVIAYFVHSFLYL